MKTKTYKTLEELATENLEQIKAGVGRPYRVKCGDQVSYAFGVSPGQAAMAVCTVETVTQKQLQAALLNELLAKQSEVKQ